MTMFLAAEHFVRAPQWLWYILFYFFFAGLSGGSYVIATLLRFSGDPRDVAAARLGYYVALVTIIVCPILLTADLAVSWSRFWHMMIDVTPGETAPIFHYWSPMSTGAWALLVFGFFAFISALDGWLGRARGGFALPFIGRLIAVIGSLLGLFIASYTGVLLSVTNQPVWSDTWTLGGLFLASGLSGAAALITLLIRHRPEAAFTIARLRQADGYFSLLELVLLVAFFATVALVGDASRLLPWIALWVVAAVGIIASLLGFRRPARATATGEVYAAAPVAIDAAILAVLVLIAVLALRAAVIFSAQ